MEFNEEESAPLNGTGTQERERELSASYLHNQSLDPIPQSEKDQIFRLKGLLRDILNPPGSGGIILQDPRTVKKRKDALISTILEEVGDDRLTTGYNITQDMTENDFYQLKKGMTSQFFVKKALEQKFGARLAEFGTSMLSPEKPKAQDEEADTPRQSPFVEGGLLDFIVMPSVSDLKQVVRAGGSRTLREIKSVTVEKLTNKIIRSFALDIAFVVPFLLFIGMQFRKASEQVDVEDGTECYAGLSMWLLSYFLFMSTFAFVKLVRVCVLRTVPHQYYFYYVCFTTAFYWLGMFVWFVVGNFTFFRSLSYTECALAGTESGP